jgi:hypothetical protein
VSWSFSFALLWRFLGGNGVAVPDSSQPGSHSISLPPTLTKALRSGKRVKEKEKKFRGAGE